MTINFKTLDQVLNQIGKTDADIANVYRGRDVGCRCGCGGHYHDYPSRGAKCALTMLRKFIYLCDVEVGSNYVNIPVGDPADNKAVTIYFK